jgi:hypothetical protein
MAEHEGKDRGHRVGCPGLPEYEGICDCGADLVAQYGEAMGRIWAEWDRRRSIVRSGRERLGE